MREKMYNVLNVDAGRGSLEELHEHVTRTHGRVIVSTDIDHRRSVLISQAELDGLERALEILSNTPSAAAMRDEVMRIAAEVADRRRFATVSYS